MVEIQKYKARIVDSNEFVIGYIAECRKYLSNGCFDNQGGVDYIISVTSKSMPGGKYGTWKVEPSSIEKFNECPICNIGELKKIFNYLACSKICYDKL